MFRPAWWISLVIGFLTGSRGGSGTEDADFCKCESGTCDEEGGDPGKPACITFEEAADLAAKRGSGVFEVASASDPANWGILNMYPENENAICKYGTCYVRKDGKVNVSVLGHQSVFINWSGCSDSAQASIVVGPLTQSTECVAHMAPGTIVVRASVAGRDDDANVQITGSCTGEGACAFINGGSVTLTTPASDDRFKFTGWSGCSTSGESTISFSDVRQPLPECIAQYSTASTEL